MEHVTLDRVKEVAAELITEFGSDFVYATNPGVACLNIPLTDEICEREALFIPGADDPRRRTGCLVGSIFTRLGAPEQVMIKKAGDSAGGVIKALTDQEGWTFEPSVHPWLLAAQRRQDGGATWGEAIGHANEYLAAWS